jgi:hypothetical protein
MEPVAIEPTTWSAVIALIAGAASIMVPAALGVVLFWLRNVKAQLDVAHALLIKQQKDLQENTVKTDQIEKQTNGRLAEQIKLNMDLQRENYALRRIFDALDMDQAGQAAMAVARARVETMKAVQRADPDRDALRRMLATKPGQEPHS